MTAKVAPQGAGVFIWMPDKCEGGDWGKIVARLQAAKVSWVALHNFYSTQAITALKAAGLYVAYSEYCTPGNAQGAVAAVTAAMADGVDGILLDMEIEWEGTAAVPYAQKRDAAIAFLTKVRTAIGDTWLGNAGAWAFPKVHYAYPDTLIAKYVDAALPERYWTEQYIGTTAQQHLDGSEAQWKTYPDVQGYKAVIPIGAGYGTNTFSPGGNQALTQPDFENFTGRQDTFAVWSYLHMPNWAWSVLGARP